MKALIVAWCVAMPALAGELALTFEEFDTSSAPKYVTNGYGQIRWTNWIVMKEAQLIPPPGLASGVVSGMNAVTNTRQNPTIYSGLPFTLRSAWITARAPEFSLTAHGYVGTVRVVTNTVRVFGQRPTLVRFQMENVTRVDFVAPVGYLAMDDVTVKVPEREIETPEFGREEILFTLAEAVSVAIGDINGDGLNDLVMAATNSVRVDLGASSGEMVAQPLAAIAEGFLILADYDLDGVKDAVLGSRVLRYGNPTTYDTTLTVQGGRSPEGIGDFYEGRRVVVGHPQSTDIVTGDFDGDGRLDYAQVNVSLPTVQFYRNTGAGFEARGVLLPNAATGIPANAVAFDFDSDNDLDLAVATDGGAEICLLWNDGTGNFPSPQMVDVGLLAPKALAVADFDGDGRHDLAVRSGFSGLSVVRGIGPREFSAPQVLTSGGSMTIPRVFASRSLAVGDLNQDGAPDIAFVSGMEVMTVLNLAPPRFRIERVADVMRVEWNFGGGWLLETSSNLEDWSPSKAKPVRVGDEWFVLDSARDVAKFFRLRRAQ